MKDTDQTTATEMIEMMKTLDKENMSRHIDMSKYTKMMMENMEINGSATTSASPHSLHNLRPDMDDIVQRIRLDRNKVLQQGMQPKNLYLGRNEWVKLRSTEEFGRASSASPSGESMGFMGFDIYLVEANEHYVMTGE